VSDLTWPLLVEVMLLIKVEIFSIMGDGTDGGILLSNEASLKQCLGWPFSIHWPQ